MVKTHLLGGLGNQMFQYAIGRSLSVKNGASLVLDLSTLMKNSDEYTQRKFDLDIFNIKYKTKIIKIPPKSLKLKFLDKYFTQYITEDEAKFYPGILRLKGRLYLYGFWQNENYFKSIEKILREDFTFKNLASDHITSFLNAITTGNSVSIHFRRGDYVSNQEAKEFHGILQPEYYKKAMDLINQKVSQPHYFIFSDDINWVKSNLEFDQEHTFVSSNANTMEDDLRLMAACKHNIVANSSFSWWGAWLNENPGKVVIAPARWYNNTPTEIVPEQWIKI